MWRTVARAVLGGLLFATWAAGLEVWGIVVRAIPGLEAVCVMPGHIHVVAPVDVRERLAQALAGLARRRNTRERRRGPLIFCLPRAEQVVGRQKISRTLRYVHVNPSRAGLVSCPLAWPLSTHRDAVGLVAKGVGPRRRGSFHTYVSSDPHADVSGTDLPGGALSVHDPCDVVVAAANILRTPMMHRLGRTVLGRSLVWEACGVLCPTCNDTLAGLLGIGGRTTRRRGTRRR